MGVLATGGTRNHDAVTCQSERSLLLGSWRLTHYWRQQLGQRVEPFGAQAYGHLMYADDGRMSATLCHPERPPLTSPPQLDWSGDEHEWAAAAQSYFAYTGSYELIISEDDSFVIDHHVEAALLPNWVGTTIRRWGRLSGNELVLTTFDPWRPLGGAAGSTLSWIKWDSAARPS
jgi:hypothetical protein